MSAAALATSAPSTEMHQDEKVTVKVHVPNSPSTAFAALSVSDSPSSSSSTSSIWTPAHIAELDSSTALVSALDAARNQPKPLIRLTGHIVPSTSSAGADHHLLSWKVAEFAYRKSTSVGSELPTLARGLFTERIDTGPSSSCSPAKEEIHRIVVRGYDKFFNLGEMAWTKPESITHYTTPPYVLTFKENGCIIFISALSPNQIVVTSKHSLGSIEGTEVTHAQKGHEWLLKHLSCVNRTEHQLAAELWRRNETAAFELCDDSFEEHVLAYSAARSGLHLHGLNSNSAQFRTRNMEDVAAFAKEWGFIPTRWIQLSSLEQVHKVTNEIEQTGAWEGEPIEGFVIRTHMPDQHHMEQLKHDTDKSRVVSPPYSPGQAWFYKVKFDEPYLMYRDWRELARRMVKEKGEYEAKLAALPATSTASTAATCFASDDGPSAASIHAESDVQGEDVAGEKSKAALKRERKRLAKATAKEAAANRVAAQAAGLLPPSAPQPRSKRPETLRFVQWCYDRLYGNLERNVKPQPALFAGLAQNKGIIAMRDAFLAYLASQSSSSPPLSKENGGESEVDERPITKTVLIPIAVPGCGKTMLAVALGELFSVGMVQSDNFKKKGGFLTAVEKDLRSHAAQTGYVLFADKNNHLFQHRDELIDLLSKLSLPNSPAEGKRKVSVEIGRIQTVALAWDLDSLPLNTLHRLCAGRIEKRGDNHQTLVADPDEETVTGLKSHETVLWRFLEALQPFGGAEGKGEGAEGYGDGRFDHVARLSVYASLEENLRSLIRQLSDLVGWKMPNDERINVALEKAGSWKVGKKALGGGKQEKEQSTGGSVVRDGSPRYFGLAVELDVRTLLDSLLPSQSNHPDIAAFYTQMRCNHRLELRPHITLVHQSNLSPNPLTPNDSDRKWSFYSHLLQPQHLPTNPEPIFHITLSTLLYQPNTLLTFPIDSITPPPHLANQFNSLHAADWTPHITVGTANPEIRPYEANRVVSEWLHNHKLPSDNVSVVHLPQPVTVEARVFGMT